MRYKHPDQLSKSKPNQSSSSSQTSKNSNQVTYQKDVEEEILESTCHLTELEDHEPKSAEIKTNNRRGANQRKSYTIDFKIKTLDLLDTMKELKTKKLWEKVAERRGVSKSLVVKWNKDHVKIRSQLALNKTKKNNGAARPTHQRRQLVCGKVRTKKFPLTAERVVVEFKLRRAKGSKISKLWLKKKMKEKVEACYEKAAVQQFKASDNWFQRFKKRHNIAFWRRSNKKKTAASNGKETIQHFHRNLRTSLKTTRRRNNAKLDAKYGRQLPKTGTMSIKFPFLL